MGSVNKLILTLRMIKIEHSVFALPFALISTFVAADGFPTWHQIIWILIAMVSARSCAMAFNRLVDLPFDRLNPRTQQWPLAAGLLSTSFVISFILVGAVVFVFSAYQLSSLAFRLSLPALFLIFFYSFTKRFTALSHWFIGLALSIAPVGAWIAIRGSLDLPPILLGCAILFWTAGFDLIYSCQDAAFDRSANLFSVPSRFGIPVALKISRICHAISVFFLLGFGYAVQLGFFYYAGCLLIAGLLAYEHTLVSPEDLTRVNEAFFTVNGLVSVFLLLFATLDLYL